MKQQYATKKVTVLLRDRISFFFSSKNLGTNATTTQKQISQFKIWTTIDTNQCSCRLRNKGFFFNFFIVDSYTKST